MFVPFHLPSRRGSTVAESYKQDNKTIGNKTVLVEGYYYLNNFNHILSSFGEGWISNIFGVLYLCVLCFPWWNVLFLCSDSVWADCGQQLVHHHGKIQIFTFTYRPSVFWIWRWSIGVDVKLLLCLFPDRKELLLWQVTGAGCISWPSI